MIVFKNWLVEMSLPEMRRPRVDKRPVRPLPFAPPSPAHFGSESMANGVDWALVISGLMLLGIAALTSQTEPEEKCCGACGRPRHNRATCPHAGSRVNFSPSIPITRRCGCCGQTRYATERHHPRGRADISDRLDLCRDCHMHCGHDGDFRNPARKPRICRVLNRPSAWRAW